MNKENNKSKCCNSPIEQVGSGDFHDKDEICTMHYECTKCKNPCDPIIKDKPKCCAMPMELHAGDCLERERILREHEKSKEEFEESCKDTGEGCVFVSTCLNCGKSNE